MSEVSFSPVEISLTLFGKTQSFLLVSDKSSLLGEFGQSGGTCFKLRSSGAVVNSLGEKQFNIHDKNAHVIHILDKKTKSNHGLIIAHERVVNGKPALILAGIDPNVAFDAEMQGFLGVKYSNASKSTKAFIGAIVRGVNQMAGQKGIRQVYSTADAGDISEKLHIRRLIQRNRLVNLKKPVRFHASYHRVLHKV
ncbi:MAG: hypothetical protein WC746_00285 [archaeon]